MEDGGMKKPNQWIMRARLARARSAVGAPIRYGLGRGGFDPTHPLPTKDGRCDCSGFVAWVLGMSRKPKLTRPWWIESTNVWRDANGRQSVFVKLDGPVPGCVVVVPDKNGHEGHIGIYAGADGRTRAPRVVDCSLGRDGIAEHRQHAFARSDAVYCVLRQDMEHTEDADGGGSALRGVELPAQSADP